MGVKEKSYEEESKLINYTMTSYKIKDIEEWLIQLFVELNYKEIDKITVNIDCKYYEISKNEYYKE